MIALAKHLIQADVNLHRAALVPKAPGFWKPQVQCTMRAKDRLMASEVSALLKVV